MHVALCTLHTTHCTMHISLCILHYTCCTLHYAKTKHVGFDLIVISLVDKKGGVTLKIANRTIGAKGYNTNYNMLQSATIPCTHPKDISDLCKIS